MTNPSPNGKLSACCNAPVIEKQYAADAGGKMHYVCTACEWGCGLLPSPSPQDVADGSNAKSNSSDLLTQQSPDGEGQAMGKAGAECTTPLTGGCSPKNTAESVPALLTDAELPSYLFDHRRMASVRSDAMSHRYCQDFDTFLEHITALQKQLEQAKERERIAVEESGQVYENGFKDGYKVSRMDYDKEWRTENEREMLLKEMEEDALSRIRSLPLQ